MRRSRPVCLLCRLRVVKATGQALAIQSNTRTAHLSTATSRHDTTRARTTGAVSRDAAHATPTPDNGPSPIRKVLAIGSQRMVPGLWAAPPRATGGQTSSRLEAVFQQIVQEQNSLQDVDVAGDKPPMPDASINLPLVRAIGKLEEMLDEDKPVEEAYLYFQTQIKPATEAPDVYVPKSYDTVVLTLLDRLVAAKKVDMFSEELPSVADIFQIYAQLGQLNPIQWAMLVRELVQHIVNLPSSAEAKSAALRGAMLSDLVESWKVLSLPQFAAPTGGKGKMMDTFWFPKLDMYALRKFALQGDFPSAFSGSFPLYQFNQLGASVATLGIATYALLRDETRCPVHVREQATQFLSRVSSLISFVGYEDSTLQRDLGNTLPNLEKYIIGLWPNIKAYLKENPMTKEESSAEMYKAPVSSGNNPVQVFDANGIRYRLGRVYDTLNFGELERLWKAFVGLEEKMSKERIAQIRYNTDLIDLFIKTRMLFRQPHLALAAWDLLAKVGLKPTVRTWNLMLDGLRRAGNAAGIKNIWAKLIRSGLKLDTPIWTTRIGGLIECGDVQGGLHALQEMANIWEKDPTANIAVMPTIEPVNAALVALIRYGRPGAADKLLAWANSKGIKPDVYTFNTRLRSLVRSENRSDDINNLLASMQAQGVVANEATYTIILDASFSEAEKRDPQSQAKIIASVASAMKTAGLTPNMQTYGKMIYLLLRANATADAMAIVNDLHSQNLELSPHIYTMLVENCLAQKPPDLESMRLFVELRRRRDFNEMDRAFYDRVASGFTWAGDIQAALDIFEHVVNSGASLSLTVLTELLNALLRQGHYEEAKKVVRREMKQFESRGTDSEKENHTQYWRHNFWQIAKRHGLLGP
ncbi:hypothetical protein F4861DRAFT_527440 [Xylaria intraflava]|nr:hypothetical protein F4861DRAFT_527440 [Xylaria intraflava]